MAEDCLNISFMGPLEPSRGGKKGPGHCASPVPVEEMELAQAEGLGGEGYQEVAWSLKTRIPCDKGTREDRGASSRDSGEDSSRGFEN